MIAEWTALRDHLRASGFPRTYIGQVPADADYPTVSLQVPGHGLPDEPTLSPCVVAEADFRVVVGDFTDSNVVLALGRIRDVLSPRGMEARIPTPGRHVTTRYVRSEFVGTDPSLSLDATNRHPGVGVDTYRIDSQPA